MAGIKVIVGGGAFESKDAWTERDLESFIKMIADEGVREIDTAQFYGDSEQVLGQIHAGKQFDIATKIPGVMVPGSFRKDEIIRRTTDSLKRLKIKQVSILYLHSPDKGIPIEETLDGIQQVYAMGMFQRFGISNYSAEYVQKIYDHQNSKGWVLPTVYQGNYNPVSRHCEVDLFPTLRRLGIAFYGYSPSAGGFLGKTKQDIINGVGRFSENGSLLSVLYNGLYNKPALLDALISWHEIAEDASTTPYNLAIRWVTFNSILKPEHGDAIIIGATNISYLQDTLAGLKEGPLSPEIVSRIDNIWREVADERHTDMVSFYISHTESAVKAS